MNVFEPFFRFAVKLLFIIFVDAVTHRGMHPDISIIVLLKFIYRIVTRRRASSAVGVNLFSFIIQYLFYSGVCVLFERAC